MGEMTTAVKVLLIVKIDRGVWLILQKDSKEIGHKQE